MDVDTPPAGHDDEGGDALDVVVDEDEVDELRCRALAMEHGALAEAYVAEKLLVHKLQAEKKARRKKRNNLRYRAVTKGAYKDNLGNPYVRAATQSATPRTKVAISYTNELALGRRSGHP